MPTTWKPLEAGEIVVAHLSDLHLGSNHAVTVWPHVSSFLTQTVKPKLLLITGDLVHSPELEAVIPGEENQTVYALAKEKLDALGLDNYFVCVGNHDRHYLGNRLTRKTLDSILKDPWIRKGRRWIQVILVALGIVYALLFTLLGGWGLAVAAVPVVITVVLLFLLAKYPGYAVAKKFDVGHTDKVFDNVFKAHILFPKQVTPYKLGSGPAAWSLGLLGLDSSSDVDYFARGLVGFDQTNVLPSATAELNVEEVERTEFDLCILLVHHHLLPIRAAEKAAPGQVMSLANVSCLVNAGTVLEQLAKARVDLALHGHEHVHNWATYGSLQRGYGPVRVVAAGSATGNDSFQGCELANATFNVLIFAPDRSVRLRRVFMQEQEWVHEEKDLVLFRPEEVRQARVRRRALRPRDKILTPNAEVTNEIIRTYIFKSDRDIEVFWVLTGWLLDEEFKHPVFNSTGKPEDPEVVLSIPGRDAVLPAATKENREGVRFDECGDHQWHLYFPVPPDFRDRPTRVTISFTWKRAALLTSEELDLIKKSGRPLGEPRNQGLEFASIWTLGQPVAALELHVSLPPEYAPPSANNPRLFVHDDFQNWGSWGDYERESADLQGRVRVLHDGRYSLRVPFPRVQRKYTLAWQPVGERHASDQLENTAFTDEFAKTSPEQAKTLLRVFGHVFRDMSVWGKATLALYVKATEGAAVKHLASIHLGPSNFEPLYALPPLQAVDLKSERNLMVRAWWSNVPVKSRPAEDAEARELGFCEHEEQLVCVPIRLSLRTTNPPPWFIVRLGVWKETMELQSKETDPTIQRRLHVAAARLLAAAFALHPRLSHEQETEHPRRRD